MSSQSAESAKGAAAPATPAAEPQKKGIWSARQIFIMVMLMLIMLSNYLDRLIMTIVQEPIKDEMGLTDLQLGLLTGPAFGILYGLSAIPIARLADRYDRITILSVSLTVWSAFTAMCAAVGSFAQLLVARAGVGMAEGGGAPSIYSLIADYFAPRQRGFATAILGMATPMAGFVAPLVGAYVATQFGWRWAFVAVGIPGIIIAIVFRLTVRDPRKTGKSNDNTAMAGEAPKPGKFLDDMKWLFTSKPFVLIFMSTMTSSLVMTSTLLFTASFLLRKFGMTLQEAGIVLSLGLGLGGIFGALLGGFVADKFSGQHGQSYMFVPAVGAAGAGLLYFTAYSVSSWAMAGFFVIAASVFQSMKNGPNFAAIQTLVPPNMRATASAVMLLAVTMIGGSVGPPLVGVLSDWAAAGAFDATLGAYAEVCSGPASQLSAAVQGPCAAASSKGLETALRIICVLYVVPVVFYYLASKHLRLVMD